MTSIAGSAAYSREYQRRRAAGLPTKGLAEQMRNGETMHRVPAKRRRMIECAFARGLTQWQIMTELDVPYEDVYTVLRGTE